MSVQSAIDRIVGEVTTQADLITQITTALAGKTAGGGGGVETCTVTVNFTGGAAGYGEFSGEAAYAYVKITSGVAEYTEGTITQDTVTFSDVSANSIFIVKGDAALSFSTTATNASLVWSTTVGKAYYLTGNATITWE